MRARFLRYDRAIGLKDAHFFVSGGNSDVYSRIDQYSQYSFSYVGQFGFYVHYYVKSLNGELCDDIADHVRQGKRGMR